MTLASAITLEQFLELGDNLFEVADITDEMELALDNLSMMARVREKRDRRRADCGKWSYWYDAHTGKRQGYIFFCDLFRDCERCLNRRAEQEKKWILDAHLEKDLVAVIVTPEEAKRIVRNTGAKKKNYVRYPYEDNGTIVEMIVIQKEFYDAGFEVDMRWILEQDWKNVVATPEGRNKSGTVHMPRTPEDEQGAFTIIDTNQIVTDAPSEMVIAEMDNIIEETSDYDPRTAEEVQECLKHRTTLLKTRLRMLEYNVTLYNKHIKLIHHKIDWSGKRQKNRENNHLYTENLTLFNSE